MPKGFRHHPNNRVWHAIEDQRAAKNMGAGAERMVPEIVADNRDCWSPVAIFFGRECATLGRRQTENGKKIRSDTSCRDSLGGRAIVQSDCGYPTCAGAEVEKDVTAKFAPALH